MRVAVRLSPRGRADRLDGIVHSADRGAILKVAVTAPPVDGRANDALLKLLAEEWGLPRRDLTLVGGGKSRSKSVHIAGDPALLLTRLAKALSVLPRS